MQELIPPIRKETLSGIEKRFMDHLLTGQRHGFFPVADSGFWHGGIHLEGDARTPVVAIADGELVAYRLNKTIQEGKLDGEKQLFSTSFVLLQHRFVTPNRATIKFYSLYMHLLPMGSYSEEQLKDGPPIFLQKRYTVTTNTDGRGLEIYDEEEKAIGLIPKGAYFEVERTLPDRGHWAGRKGYKEVRYGEIEGYAELRNNAVLVSGTQWKVTTIKHSPLDPADMGLNVRDRSNSTARVLRVAPRGSIIRFKEPKALTDAKVLRDNTYYELKEGGFVSYSAVNIEAKPVVREDLAYDSVERPEQKIVVRQGDILGYAGKYCEHASIVHFEIFTDDVGFLQNPGNDKWGRRILKLKPGAVLKIKETKTVLVNRRNKTQTVFETNAGICAVAIGAPEQGIPYTDEAGTVWHEVLFDFERKKTGWIAANDANVEGIFSPYEWSKLWEGPLEDSEFADDGFVDTPRLFERLDTNKDKKIDYQELKHAYAQANDRQWLKRLICKHPSEWDAGQNGTKWNRLKEAPWNYKGSKAVFFDQALAHIKALQWWSQAGGAAPASPNVYHFHPIGFIEHMNMMAVPLSHDERMSIMRIISKFEGNFDSCNEDEEFKGDKGNFTKVAYRKLVHIGLSWGFIQFTQDGGPLGKVLTRMHDRDPTKFAEVFGDNYRELLTLTNAEGVSGQDQWASERNAKSKKWERYEEERIAAEAAQRVENEKAAKDGRAPVKLPVVKIPEYRSARVQKIKVNLPTATNHAPKIEDLWEGTWLARFQAAGGVPVFQEAQMEEAMVSYLKPALKICKRFGVRSAKGIAIAFDRCVNMGTGSEEKLNGTWGVFYRAANRQFSFFPATEQDYLIKVQNQFSSDPRSQGFDSYSRIGKILKTNSLVVTNYDPETY